MSDRIVLGGILIAVVGAWVAGSFGAFGPGLMTIIVPVVVTLIAAFFGAWQLDRRNRDINVSAHYDENRANFDVPMNNNRTWQIPTAYIDHKTGGGPPPGVESYDEDALDPSRDSDAVINAREADIAP